MDCFPNLDLILVRHVCFWWRSDYKRIFEGQIFPFARWLLSSILSHFLHWGYLLSVGGNPSALTIRMSLCSNLPPLSLPTSAELHWHPCVILFLSHLTIQEIKSRKRSPSAAGHASHTAIPPFTWPTMRLLATTSLLPVFPYLISSASLLLQANQSYSPSIFLPSSNNGFSDPKNPYVGPVNPTVITWVLHKHA